MARNSPAVRGVQDFLAAGAVPAAMSSVASLADPARDATAKAGSA